LAGLSDASREAFWRQLDVAYFLRHDASDVAWHTRHLYYQSTPDHAVVRARPTEQGEGLQIMVYMCDRPDLFVAICAYFDDRSLSIQDARIHTTRHGWALDSFIVLLPDGMTDFRAQASLIEHELTERLKDPNQFGAWRREALPQFGRNRQSRMSRMFPVRPQAELQPDDNSTSWRLSVTATDRPGLLHALARVFAERNVNLRMAKVMTLGDRVEDVFIIDGSALERPRIQMQFERDVLDALAGDGSVKKAA
jgi:[protein-PII] uridylyltransferase